MLKTGLLSGILAALMLIGCGDKDPVSSTGAENEGPPAGIDDSPNTIAPDEPHPDQMTYEVWSGADLAADLNADGLIDRADFAAFLDKNLGGREPGDDVLEPVDGKDRDGGRTSGTTPVEDGTPISTDRVPLPPEVIVDETPADQHQGSDSQDGEPAVDIAKIDIRGNITTVSEASASGQERGIMGVVLVEGLIEEDTSFDKAAVDITEKTRIFARDGEELRPATFASLEVGQKVEAVFTGPVRESYPVQVTAMAIVIVK